MARGLDSGGAGRLGRRNGRRLHLHGGDLARDGADRGLRDHPHRGQGDPAVRHRRAEGTDPRRHRPRGGRGNRDDRARIRVRRRVPADVRSALQRRLRPERPEGLHLQRAHLRSHPRRRPHDQDRAQARRPDDDLGSARRARARDQADRDDGRARDQLPLPHRLRGACRRRPGRGRPRLDAAHGRPERRAPDPGGDHARPCRARLRRRPRLRQGAQAVRQADRLVPGPPAPLRGPRHGPRGGAPDDLLGRRRRSTRTPTACCRARPPW